MPGSCPARPRARSPDSRRRGRRRRARPTEHCIFCQRLRAGDLIADNKAAAAFPDAFPLTPGHALIVPWRHEADFLALTPAEHVAIWRLVPAVRAAVERDHRPDGYNLGINVGEAAGQTVAHAHLHVIPRYRGDVQEPRGGIRWIIPARARYWLT